MKVVIDTSVFVSSIFGGLPRRVVEQWFTRRITLCLSEEIFAEYQRVLRTLDAVSRDEERDLVAAFAAGDAVLYVEAPPSVEVVSADPADDKFLACAVALEADYIVSGDSDLLELDAYMGIPVVTPRAFLNELGEGLDT